MPYNTQDAPQGALIAYTPTASAASPGATPPTFGTLTGRYVLLTPKLLFLIVTVPITAAGTGANGITASLPPGLVATANTNCALSGNEFSQTSKGLTVQMASGGSALRALFFDGTHPGASGNTLVISGLVELA